MSVSLCLLGEVGEWGSASEEIRQHKFRNKNPPPPFKKNIKKNPPKKIFYKVFKIGLRFM